MVNREKLLFRFAVVGDTHLKQESSDGSAAWEVNNLSVRRNRFIANEIFRINPEFVIHIGDIVHPVPDLPTFQPAVTLFKTIYSKLLDRMHFVPGNHDIGDKSNSWIPQKKVSSKLIAQYESSFGETYKSFMFNDCAFIIINSSIFNSDLPIERLQQTWLLAELERHRSRRIFIFSHYPLFLSEEGEPTNYDNVDQPARSYMIRLIQEYKVEGLFSGHVHNYFYNRVDATELYCGLSTSFVRQDFSELARIEAADVNGRNDVDKLGFFSVEVFAAGHVTHVHRSFGKELSDGCIPETQERISLVHTKTVTFCPVGFHLRHPWAETVDLPYNAPMDEFFRKKVRNDYQVLALSELGARHLRIPISDLSDVKVASRVSDLSRAGHSFTVFCPGMPDEFQQDLIRSCRESIHTVEVIIPEIDIEEFASNSLIEKLAIISLSLPIPITLSRVATRPVGADRNARFLQYIDQGFDLDENKLIDIIALLSSNNSNIRNISFRLSNKSFYSDQISRLAAISRQFGMGVIAHVRLAADNPAENLIDDIKVANCVAEVIFATHAFQSITAFFDTFMDIDRGYYVRNGVIDRRFNLRLGGFVFKNLNSILNSVKIDLVEVAEIPVTDGRVIIRRDPELCLFLVVGSSHSAFVSALIAFRVGGLDSMFDVTVFDLSSGSVLRLPFQALIQDFARYQPLIDYRHPILVRIDVGGRLATFQDQELDVGVG